MKTAPEGAVFGLKIENKVSRHIQKNGRPYFSIFKEIIDEVESKREKIDKAREQISELIDSIDSIVPKKLKITFEK